MSNSKDFKKIAWCHVCSQGWVEILKEKITGKLYLACAECETEWDDPKLIQEDNKGTHEKYGLSENPTKEEIEQAGWERYILNP